MILLCVSLVLHAAVLASRCCAQVDLHDVGALPAGGVLLQNLFPAAVIRPGGLLTGIAPAWSLGAELVFYLLLPVLASGTATRTQHLLPRRRAEPS